MPLPVDIDVGPTAAARAQQPGTQPAAGRPAARAAEAAWVAAHTAPAQPPAPARRHALSFGAWLLGLASMTCLFVGCLVALVAARIPHDGLASFGSWTVAAGVGLLVLLIVRSDRR